MTTAWKNSRLVGLIRVVGDAVSIIYIQDIIVLPEFHRKGIGSLLMENVLTKFEHVRQKVLLAQDDENLNSFYRKFGFVASTDQSCIAYMNRKPENRLQ